MSNSRYIERQTLKQIDMFEDFTQNELDPKNSFETPTSSGTKTTKKAIEGKEKKENFETLLKKSLVVIGPIKGKAIKQITNKQKLINPNLRQVLTRGISTKSNQKKKFETPRPVFETNVPKFELNEIPDENVKEAEPVFELNNPEVDLNTNQPATFESQHPPDFMPQQPAGFVPQQPAGFVPQQPAGFVPQQPAGFVPQQPAGFMPQQPAGFVPQQPGSCFETPQPVGFIPQQPVGFEPHQPTGFVPQQPAGFDPQQPVAFQLQQSSGFEPQLPAEFVPQQPTSFELNQQPELLTYQQTGFADQETAQHQIAGFNSNQNQAMHFNRNHMQYQAENMHITGLTKFSYPKGIPKSMVHAQRQEMQALMNQSSPAKQERQPTWILNDAKNLSPDQSRNSVDRPVFIDTSSSAHHSQAYSPSDVYEEMQINSTGDGDAAHGQKRVSAFQRLGPQTQPKTPKITINLNLENEQPVREVVDETDVYDDDKYSPVHLRPDVINSTDETVMKYLIHWPWKKEVHRKRSVGPRSSKSAMLLELEKMEECYDRENAYVMVEVRSYPASWTKEDVLDAILESVKDKSFIPCFIDFTKRKCTFLVMRSKPALVQIHKQGFVVHKGDVELRLFISSIHLSLNHMDFIPRLVLRKRVTMGYDGESKLDLKEFTLKEDISHFIYFPLNRSINQTEIIELKSTVAWKNLTRLDLSYNRLTSISGFSLATVSPKLKYLDLSHNLLNRITLLLCCRDLPLNSISLEGNPLCLDYTDDGHYIKVIRMMFPTVNVIDGEKVHIAGKMPTFKKHYCRHDVKAIVDKFLEVFFPLLDSDEEQRSNMENLYDTRAVMTVTYNHKLRCKPVYRCFRNMFMWVRVIEEGNFDSLEGASAIMKLVNKWPAIQHDPSTFNVDVMYHTDTTTIVRICGVLKLTAKTLADDEYLLAFTRTFVLKTENGAEYKIRHEMVYWDEPTKEYVKQAFQINTISTLQLTLKLDSEPDKDLQEKLLKIFMKVTNMDRRASLRCLEEKNWHFKEALEYYTKLLKMDSLSTIMKA